MKKRNKENKMIFKHHPKEEAEIYCVHIYDKPKEQLPVLH